jgi:hypothetical protein
MGDLNAKHPTFWKDDPVTTEGRTLVSLINTLGMKQLIREPTRVTASSRSCIDVLFTDNANSVISAGVRDKLASNCDHCPIFAHVKTTIPKPKKLQENGVAL